MVSDAAKKETSLIWTRFLLVSPIVGVMLGIMSYLFLEFILNSEMPFINKFVISLGIGLISFSLGVMGAFYGTHLVRVSYAKKFCEAL